jgi:sugar/nucleoside kinase (ribokinase family)
VGDDVVGASLVAELSSLGVDMSCVRRADTTGTIVVLVDEHGERSMLTDRRACLQLDGPDASWLDGVATLHVPLYSLTDPPLSDTAVTLIDWAHLRGAAVSVDASSVALIDAIGADAVHELLGRLDPTVVFANHDEARALDVTASIGDALTVVKHGSQPALIYQPGQDPIEVPAVRIREVHDTTGAGDAFTAGFLTHIGDRGVTSGWVGDPVAACAAGHQVAADLIARR